MSQPAIFSVASLPYLSSLWRIKVISVPSAAAEASEDRSDNLHISIHNLNIIALDVKGGEQKTEELDKEIPCRLC